MLLRLTRTLDGEVKGSTTHGRLIEARRVAGRSLNDNGVLGKAEAQKLAMSLAIGSPISAGDYTFTLEVA